MNSVVVKKRCRRGVGAHVSARRGHARLGAMSVVAGAGLAVLRSELLEGAPSRPRVLEDTCGMLQIPCMMSRLDKLRPKKDLGTVIDLWQDRFFVLCSDRLLYFKSKTLASCTLAACHATMPNTMKFFCSMVAGVV